MNNLKTFEEFKFKLPFLNKTRPSDAVSKRKEILSDCGIEDTPYYNNLIAKLGDYGLYVELPHVVVYNGYGKKENHFVTYVNDLKTNEHKYMIDIFPNSSGTYGPGMPPGNDQDSWGESDFAFISKCKVTNLSNYNIEETDSLWQSIYKVLDIEKK